MTWWQEKPELYKEVLLEISENFPKLVTGIENNRVVISGTWSVFGKEKHIIDYDIKIELPDDYPVNLPRVWETSNQLPKIPDRHFNSKDADACLCSRPERWEKWPPGSSISAFLDGLVKEFFFSQAYYDIEKRWPFGQWSHEALGIVEYFAKKLSCTDLVKLKRMLELALLPKLFRQWECPCGSKDRVTKCHGPLIRAITATLPAEEIRIGIGAILKEQQSGRRAISLADIEPAPAGLT
jgi:hypothetical protein